MDRASAMNAAGPFMALESSLSFPGFPTWGNEVKPASAPAGEEWASIDCSRKTAHGCGEHGERLLGGITLYVRRDDPPFVTAALSVFLNEEARRGVEAELGIRPHGAVAAQGAVKIAREEKEQLLVLMLVFTAPHSSRRAYYLVHDATDASLHLVPSIPANLVCSYTTTPVPRFTGGGGRDHELVLMATGLCPTNIHIGGFVCVCSSPATRANEGSNEFESKSTGVWQVKRRHFPELPHGFLPQQMFCFQGKLFWADFTQGLVHCDLRTGDPFARFGFISLPHEYLLPGVTESPAKRRTIGYAGNSIYFLCIDHHHRRPGDQILKVWTLDMDDGNTWKRHRGFPCPWKEIWRQIDFMDAGAGARCCDDVEPQYPVLMPGGAGFCLYLHQERRRTREPDYICSFDMHSKRPLWFGPVRDDDSASFILPTNFFATRNYTLPPPPTRSSARKRKLEKRSAKNQEECAKTCKPRYPSHSSRLE